MEFPPIYPKLSNVEMDYDYPYEIVKHCSEQLDWLLCKQVPSDYDKAYSYFTYLGQNAKLLSGDALRDLQEKREFFGKLSFKLGGYRMCVSSIATTCDDHYCNDEILRGIMSWLQYKYPSSYNNVTIFDSFLLLKYADKNMKTHDRIGIYNYSYHSVRSWFRKRNEAMPNPLEHEKIIMFCNQGEDHWYLCCIFPKKKVIEQYNSYGRNNETLYAAFNWLRDECKDQGIDWNDDDWKLRIRRVPHQENSHCCGLFAVYYAHLVSSGVPFSVTQSGVLSQLCKKAAFSLAFGTWKTQYHAILKGEKSILPVLDKKAKKMFSFLKKIWYWKQWKAC